MARILLIDDDQTFRDTVAEILEEVGHVVTAAENGRTGLERFQEQVPDLVVTDIVMPEAEGIETVRAIRALGSNVPILAISGLRTNKVDYLRVALAFGVNETLQKPVRRAALLAAIDRALAQTVERG